MEPMKPIARKLDPKELYLKEAVESALAHHLFTTLFLIKELLKESMQCLPAERRADILMQCAGLTMRKMALKMDAQSVANMLELAIASEDTTAEQILEALTTDDLVRYVDPKKIFGVLVRTECFNKSTPEHRLFMTVLLNGLIQHKLLDDVKQKPPLDTPDAIVELIGYDQFMGDRMPPDLRTEYFKHCVLLARGALPGGTRTPRHFPASDMLKQMFKPEVLVQHLEPLVLYCVFEAVALKYGWIEKSEPAAPAATGNDPAALPPLPGAGDAGAAASASGANGKGQQPIDDGEPEDIEVAHPATDALQGLDVPGPLDGPPLEAKLEIDLDFLEQGGAPPPPADPEASSDPHNALTPPAVPAVPRPGGKPLPPPPPRPQGK